ncbi:binding-protein-dependent transport systems inner membrane component [Desulfovibrio ferrophilus]|uniref:Binding-protein-dependent transport systems inner membrane component n=1 Tax=Desulfovibrio ferrophilus TaxID=241368 RepID=A0A2Z6AXG4_9BACT|nr:binding-protein-dependent transport systems inner membrane component [Desulfovibrio ferrophilus]
MGGLLQDVEFWGTIGLTLARGACGLVMALTAALILGIPAGLSPGFIRLLGPLVAALQSCPPVLWISLVLVWVGTGSAVPVVAVFASIFPILFINISQGCLSIDRRLLTMASLYKVSAARKLTHIILPGVTPALLAGLSYALSATWKVAAVAEYLGSGEGIGARIYWAYRMLDIPDLFAWALVLAGIGVGLEMSLVARLRNLAARFRTTTRESA